MLGTIPRSPGTSICSFLERTSLIQSRCPGIGVEGFARPLRSANYDSVNRLLAGGALAIFIAAIAVIALSSVGSKSSETRATTTTAATTKPARRPQPPEPAPKPARIKLVAVGPYDPPPGDGTENDAEVANAVDGNASTFWSTEHYTHGFFKPGVGIVLDAGTKRPIGRVLVGTDDAGARAEIQLDRPADGAVPVGVGRQGAPAGDDRVPAEARGVRTLRAGVGDDRADRHRGGAHHRGARARTLAVAWPPWPSPPP